jgi:hypothetical protein
MFEKITGYTDKMEMLKKTNVINAGSSNPARLTGNTEDSIIVIRKTIFTKIKGVQPVVIFLDALWYNGQT